jgi:CheY-like chemotaxis protein
LPIKGTEMKTVLIVDDEELFVRAFAAGLTAHDPSIRVLTARNGAAATRLLAANDVDLLLTDLDMPEMSGVELTAYAARYHPDVPVLVITAFGSPQVCDRLRAFGVVGLFDKPTDLAAVYGRIRSTLDVPTHPAVLDGRAGESPAGGGSPSRPHGCEGHER